MGSPSCASPLILLPELAKVLNACDKAGINPRLAYGIIYTDIGIVLPVRDRWAARALTKIKP